MQDVINYFFIDKDQSDENGLEFFAAGIVESKHFNEKPNVSGKDYCVVYICPFGFVERAWRSVNEIKMYQVDKTEFE